MSPYFFILYMDRLSHIINDAIKDSDWILIKAGKFGPPISHLIFVNDLILSGKAYVKQIDNTLNCS